MTAERIDAKLSEMKAKLIKANVAHRDEPEKFEHVVHNMIYGAYYLGEQNGERND